MQFGRLERVDRVKFFLPPDHAMTREVLQDTKKRTLPLKVYVGCPVYSDPKLVNRIYPKGTKPADFLRIYATQFNSLEQNSTGYGIPTLEEVRKDIASVPKTFVFCPKVSQQIARSAPLAKNQELLKQFIESMHAYGRNLGAVFLQLHPSFGPPKLDQLLSFVDMWDKSLPLHIELRHKDWFSGASEFETLLQVMRKNGVGTVIMDVTGLRSTLHQALTTKSAFIRFDAHDLHKSDFTRLDQWADRIRTWIEFGLETLYFFVHTESKYLNPELARYFIKRLNITTGLLLAQ